MKVFLKGNRAGKNFSPPCFFLRIPPIKFLFKKSRMAYKGGISLELGNNHKPKNKRRGIHGL